VSQFGVCLKLLAKHKPFQHAQGVCLNSGCVYNY